MANALENLSKRTSRYTDSNIIQLVQATSYHLFNIPVFTGNYLKWTSFSDIFKTLIHNKTSLTSIEKFEYLKTYVDDEPLRLIRSYALSGENYAANLKALESRYNSRRQRVTKHLDNMHRAIGKIATAQSIRTLYDGINESLAALSNMGYDVTTWDPFTTLNYSMRKVTMCSNNSMSLTPTKYLPYRRLLEISGPKIQNIGTQRWK